MVSKNNNNKVVFATLALTLLSLSVASSIAISTPNYASAQGVTVEGGDGSGNATNATMIGEPAAVTGNATNATSTGGSETAGGTQIGGPLSLYGGGGGQ
ncbi:MAG TPA: hypothetical protein VE264_07835 [Nitrososphaera sp.]|jgi:hypothetical protein|nr:hypothetical protein [Nitrososphaera sp.]